MIDESVGICFQDRWRKKLGVGDAFEEGEVDGGEIDERGKSGQDPTAVGSSGSNERLDVCVDYGDVVKDLGNCCSLLEGKSVDDRGAEKEEVFDVNYDCESRTVGDLIAGLEIVK